MKSKIGETAGKVWNVLSEKGDITITQLTKETKEDGFFVAAAIGWLAREDKINVYARGKSKRVTLR